MAEIINLRLARKRKQRADAQVVAQANRLAHGRTKAKKSLDQTKRISEQRHLDAHKRDKREEE